MYVNKEHNMYNQLATVYIISYLGLIKGVRGFTPGCILYTLRLANLVPMLVLSNEVQHRGQSQFHHSL